MSAVNDRLSETIGRYGVSCPVCGTGPWSIGRLDQDQLRYDPAAPRLPEAREVQAVCATCGYVLAFRIAPLMGEWEDDQAEEE